MTKQGHHQPLKARTEWKSWLHYAWCGPYGFWLRQSECYGRSRQ